MLTAEVEPFMLHGDSVLGRLLQEALATTSDDLGCSGCCWVISFPPHLLKKEHTVSLGVTDFLWVKYARRLDLGWSRSEMKDFQKHVWDEKGRHTLPHGPVGSWVDRACRCTGSFLSCWNTCDSTHSVCSAPDTHQYRDSIRHKASSEKVIPADTDIWLEYRGLTSSLPHE
jgi:hypothetical protein